MIQKFSVLKILDNSGGKFAMCIHIYNGYRKRYAKMGDIIKVTLIDVKPNIKKKIKLKKGQLVKGVILQSKIGKKSLNGYYWQFIKNGIALLTDKNKIIATKVLVPVLRIFRKTKLLRLAIKAKQLLV